jgi:hypothetical protein
MLRGRGWSFIHIPKCGGTTLRHHLTGSEYGKLIPLGSACPIRSPLHRIPHFRPTGRVFAVVRHPAAWLRSFWIDQSPERVGVVRYLHQFWTDDLNRFVENVCNHSPGYVCKMYNAHIRYRNVKVFRLEDGLEHVFKWLGLPVPRLDKINGSPESPQQLTEQTRALVAEIERDAIQGFGY